MLDEINYLQPLYTIYDLGYTRSFIKDDAFYNDLPMTQSAFENPVNPANIMSGGTISNLYIADSQLQSENFVSGESGWMLGPTSSEFIDVIISGTLTAGNIHIPDQNTTANSFHVQDDGDTWWGCTETNFNSNPSNAVAYVLKTGATKFSLGTVGGWSLADTTISAVNGSNTVTLASGGTYAFIAGTTGDPDVTITHTGVLTANGAVIEGQLTASTGYIGGVTGWVIAAGLISSVNAGNTTGIASGGTNAFYAGPTGAPTVIITHAGALTATSATITGAITANTGYIGGIGGWVIAAGQISSVNSGNTTILASGGANAFAAGPTGSPNVTITHTGILTATGADISGEITATSGVIGGWQILAAHIATNAVEGDATISLAAAGTIRVGDTAGNYLLIDGNNLRIRSSNYVAGLLGSGFTLEPNLLEVGNISARGRITTAVFEQDSISSVGGTLIISDSDTLDADMTAADNSTLTVTGSTTFILNQIVRMKIGVDDEYLQITDISGAPTYVVTRDLAGSYAANSNPAWPIGTAVVAWGMLDWNYLQTFEDLNLGDLNGQDSWVTEGDATTNVVNTKGSPFESGPSSGYDSSTKWAEMLIESPGVGGNMTAYRPLSNFTAAQFFFAYYISSSTSAHSSTYRITIRGQNSTSFKLQMTAGGVWHLMGGTDDVVISNTQNWDTWQTFTVEFDAGRGSNGQVKARLNEEEWTTWIDINETNSFTYADRITFYGQSEENPTTTKIYFVFDSILPGDESRRGFIEFDATTDTDASPYMRIATRDAFNYSDTITKLLIGNLFAITGEVEYGIASESQAIKISNRGIDINEGIYDYPLHENRPNWQCWRTNGFTEDAAIIGSYKSGTDRKFYNLTIHDAGASYPTNNYAYFGAVKDTTSDLGLSSAANAFLKAQISGTTTLSPTIGIYAYKDTGQPSAVATAEVFGYNITKIYTQSSSSITLTEGTGIAIVVPDAKSTALTFKEGTNSYLIFDTTDSAETIDIYKPLTFRAAQEIRFRDADNSNYVGFKAPSLSANKIWILPNADGAANTALKTDGSANLSWVNPLTLGNLDDVANVNFADPNDDRIMFWDDTASQFTGLDPEDWVRISDTTLSTRYSGAKAYRITYTHNSTGNWLEISWDNELIDTDTYHDNSTNPARLTAPWTGLYYYCFKFLFVVSSTGYRGLRVKLNGTQIDYDERSGVANCGTALRCSGIIQMTAGQYLTCDTYQSSGGNLNMDAVNVEASGAQIAFIGSD